MRMMAILLLPGVFLSAQTLPTGPADSRVLSQHWETITLDGAPAGTVSSQVREVRTGEQTRRVHIQDLRLNLRRGNGTVELRQEHGLEEDLEGKVVGLFLRQYQGSKVFLELTGQVDSGPPARLEILRDGKTSRQPWYDETYRPANLDEPPGKKRWETGDTAVVRLYEPTYNRIVRYDAVAQEKETLTLQGQRVPVTPLKLVPEMLVGGTQRVSLPTIRWWVDDEGRVRRRELDMPGLGLLTLTRSEYGSKAPPVAVPVVDVLDRGLIPLAKTVARPYTSSVARLRVTVRDVAEPGRALRSDEHQTVREIRPGVLDVVVHPVGDQARNEPVPGPEYRDSGSLIDWQDRSVQTLLNRLGPGPRDPWQRAQARAAWVRQNLRTDNSVPLMPVSQVAREMRGDCRHAALLTTALCRADGLPARTAVGLVYIERNRRPFLGFHLWSEVYVDGAWRGLDGTPGMGSVGALHLKVSDASWHRETTLAPLQSALNLVGKLNVEVVEIVE